MDDPFAVNDARGDDGPETSPPEHAAEQDSVAAPFEERAVDETAPGEDASADVAFDEEASAEYVGRWNRLLSTTNWEKGRIISEWRARLIDAGAPSQAFSDEAWSRRVGSVSSQHVGRLRRVHDRFHEVYEQYPGLYWSHFQAALDWDDAEMWLEGAVQNAWSVAQMRTTRWEALGAPAGAKPKPEDVTLAELDEDVDPALDASSEDPSGQIPGAFSTLASDEPQGPAEAVVTATGEPSPSPGQPAVAEPADSLESLPPLPSDLAEAYAAFREAILRHKEEGWEEISRQRVLGVIKSLKRLALAGS